MNIRKWTLPALAALIAWALAACTTSSGFDPIEVDLSTARKTPAAAPTATAPAPPAATSAPPTPPPTIAARPAEPAPTVPTRSERAPSPAPSPAPPPAVVLPATTAGPEAAVEARADAYNRRDLDRLVGLYSNDAQIYEPPDRLRDSGSARIRQTYARRFASAVESKLEVRDVVRQGAYVVSRETESSAGGESSTALVISEVREGRIVRVWILR